MDSADDLNWIPNGREADRFMNKYDIMILGSVYAAHVFNLRQIMSHQSFVTESVPLSQISSPFISTWQKNRNRKIGQLSFFNA